MSDLQTSLVPDTPTPNNLAIANWAALLPTAASDEPPLTWQADRLLFERRVRPPSLRRGIKISLIWAVGMSYIASNREKVYEAWLYS